jgi:hypothetical protein
MDCDGYMEQPEGFAQGDPRQTVCLLQKSIYGTKQGGNRWNKKMQAVLESLGFTQSYSDASIYVYVKGDTRVILPVFVDNMTPASKSAAAIDQIILELSQHFTLTLVTPFRVPLRLYYVYRSKGLRRGGFGVVWPMFLWYFPKYIGTKM